MCISKGTKKLFYHSPKIDKPRDVQGTFSVRAEIDVIFPRNGQLV